MVNAKTSPVKIAIYRTVKLVKINDAVTLPSDTLVWPTRVGAYPNGKMLACCPVPRNAIEAEGTTITSIPIDDDPVDLINCWEKENKVTKWENLFNER
ncbi:MAG: hypothetical protein Q4C83_01055 [Candidatus Saccharibacteria bacterium]|nr:hypothetical protein [Candidatus Saccharibacteria bacterium]